jgi:ABC-type proline/glycine betaine transport system ATPase subunit
MHVTHSQLEAIALADMVVVMDRGQIKQAGPVRDVYAVRRDDVDLIRPGVGLAPDTSSPASRLLAVEYTRSAMWWRPGLAASRACLPKQLP